MTEYVEERIIQKTGGSNQVSLPMRWVKAQGLRPGDKVKVVYNGILKIIPIEEPSMELGTEPLDIKVKGNKILFTFGSKVRNMRISIVQKCVDKYGFDGMLNRLERALKKHYPFDTIEASHEEVRKVLKEICSSSKDVCFLKRNMKSSRNSTLE